jgi:hypothetical protein
MNRLLIGIKNSKLIECNKIFLILDYEEFKFMNISYMKSYYDGDLF